MLKDLVLRVLNQTVGEYFENIDASQLQLSVFSGNIVLQDLVLKRNVCENLGLPFRVICGKCAKLNVKIPWTFLTSQPVEVDIQDLYLLLVPGWSLPYDETTEEKVRHRLKLQLLENIQAAQRELESNGNPTEPGYFERIAMQIVKNLQLRIDSVHLRFEDQETNPVKSFAIGAVLSKLSILTTDSEWTPRYVYDNLTTVHKLFNVEGFALYWDCNSLLVSKTETELDASVSRLKEMLKKANFDYVVGPISIITKTVLNISPEKGPNPFTVPKVGIEAVMDELVIGMSNLQFQDMLYMAVAMEGIFRKEHYKKYRPLTKVYKGNYRVWWKFAYDCINEDIQRKRNNWRWIRMRQHRRDCKSYHTALYTKYILKHGTPALDREIDELEHRLDIFNILLIRKQTDLCRERQVKTELKLRSEQSWMDWLCSFVGPTALTEELNTPVEPLTPQEMSEEEKLALLVAIGFTHASTVVIHSPPEYVEAHLGFRLNKLKVIVTQDDRRWNARHSVSQGPKNTILDLQIVSCNLNLDCRPGNHGLKLTCNLTSLDVYGGDAPRNTLHGDPPGLETVAHIIAPRKLKCIDNFLDITYELAPLNSNFDQRLWVHGHPLDITYDSATIDKLSCCFTIPKHVPLEKLQTEAMLTYTNLTARSRTSLNKLITKNQDNFEMDIHIEAPCLIIPQTCFTPSIMSVTVVELGALIITSQLLQL